MSKVWLVTGCSRGLGRELAQAVLAAGHRLVATARDPRAAWLSCAERAPAHRRAGRRRPGGGPRRGRRRHLCVRPPRRRRQQRRLHQGQLHRGPARGRIPPADRDQSLRRLQRHARCLARDARPARRTHHPDFVHRRAARHARPRRLPGGEVGGRRVQRGAGARGRAARHPRHLRRARRNAHRHVRPVDARRSRWRRTTNRRSAPSSAPPSAAPRAARSDPAKVARAILRLADEEQPPVHLFLGSDAVSVAAATLATRAAEDERWRTLSLSTDHDGLGDPAGRDRA